MRKTLTFLFLAILSIAAFGQQVELTVNGFVDINDKTKNFLVIEVPNTSKEALFKKVKKYVNTVYNNPKFVSSEIENEQIVIDAMDSKKMLVIFRLSGINLWSLNYKYDIQFKDNKIKFTPYFKYLSNADDSETINLIGLSFLGNASGVFNSKSKVLREKAKVSIENSVNKYIEELKTELTNPTKIQETGW